MPVLQPFSTPTIPYTGGYIGSFYFRVTVAGFTRQDFLKVTGVAHETEEMAFKHGTDYWVRKGAGRHIAAELTLERVYSGVSDFSDWRDLVIAGTDARKTVKVEYMAPDGATVVASYICHQCWPKKWDMPEMDAGSTNPAIEKIVLAVEQIEKETVAQQSGVAETAR